MYLNQKDLILIPNNIKHLYLIWILIIKAILINITWINTFLKKLKSNLSTGLIGELEIRSPLIILKFIKLQIKILFIINLINKLTLNHKNKMNSLTKWGQKVVLIGLELKN